MAAEPKQAGPAKFRQRPGVTGNVPTSFTDGITQNWAYAAGVWSGSLDGYMRADLLDSPPDDSRPQIPAEALAGSFQKAAGYIPFASTMVVALLEDGTSFVKLIRNVGGDVEEINASGQFTIFLDFAFTSIEGTIHSVYETSGGTATLGLRYALRNRRVMEVVTTGASLWVPGTSNPASYRPLIGRGELHQILYS